MQSICTECRIKVIKMFKNITVYKFVDEFFLIIVSANSVSLTCKYTNTVEILCKDSDSLSLLLCAFYCVLLALFQYSCVYSCTIWGSPLWIVFFNENIGKLRKKVSLYCFKWC